MPRAAPASRPAAQTGPSRLGILRLLEGSPMAVVAFALDGRILFANSQSTRLFGLNRAAMPAKFCLAIAVPFGRKASLSLSSDSPKLLGDDSSL